MISDTFSRPLDISPLKTLVRHWGIATLVMKRPRRPGAGAGCTRGQAKAALGLLAGYAHSRGHGNRRRHYFTAFSQSRITLFQPTQVVHTLKTAGRDDSFFNTLSIMSSAASSATDTSTSPVTWGGSQPSGGV